jgi:hypothetical protein
MRKDELLLKLSSTILYAVVIVTLLYIVIFDYPLWIKLIWAGGFTSTGILVVECWTLPIRRKTIKQYYGINNAEDYLKEEGA